MSYWLFIIRYWLFVVCSLLFFQTTFAQLDNTFLRDEIAVSEKDSNQFGINFSLFNYMRNTEYFNKIEVGRTLFGYQFQPKFFYQPNQHIKFEAGIFLRNDFGGINPYTEALPTFTLKVQNKNFSFLFGTLEGSLSHRLIEPMYNIEYPITRRIENGAQFKYNSKKIFFDAWVNWENFIERGSPNKEIVTAGVSSMVSIFESLNGFKIKIPVQFLIHHHGGQINTDSLNMTVQMNVASGLRISQKFEESFIKEIRLDGYYTIYKESTNSGYFPFRDGNAVYANALVSSIFLDVMLSYWNGNNYLAPCGTYIYQSQSVDVPTYTEKNRELFFIRLMHEQPLFGNLYLTARFEPVYDLRNKILDYSYSVFLCYKKEFELRKK